MDNFVPVLSTVSFILALSSLLLLFFVNIYFKIRRKLPISVNCWFCNSWAKVHYDDRNSFNCPICLQYNGFTKDGDYNKTIPEQHDELMNRNTQIKNCKTITSNGLCALCNNNQQLKIFQLANFVPLVEENYDVEIEHFQAQLEKAYKLCKKCDKVLKKTIEKQNAWIFGNRIKNLCNGGIASIQKLSNHVSNNTKLTVVSKLNGILSVILVISIIIVILSSIKYVTRNILKYLPMAYTSVFKSIIILANPQKPYKFVSSYFSQEIKFDPFITICCSGLVLQTITTIWEKYSMTVKLNRYLCWIILLLTSYIRFHKNYTTYILLIEAFCCIYLLFTSFNKIEEKCNKKSSNKFMRKVVKNLEYTCTDFSDVSDFEDISTSSKKTSITHDSSDFLNKTTYSNPVPVQQNNTADNVLNYSDLNKSLNNLSLGGFQCRSPQSFSVASVPLKRPKPVLSPPRFQTVNSWVAGGYWKNADGIFLPLQRTTLSRSSSESSGFGSQHNDNIQFVQMDKLSANSEFCAHFKPNQSMFVPVYNQLYPNLPLQGSFGGGFNPMRFNEPYQRRNLYQNWSDKINSQATQSFRDLGLQSNYN